MHSPGAEPIAVLGARIALPGWHKVKREKLLRAVTVVGATVVVSLLHYYTATGHLWLHQLFQRAYYVPVLLAALWFGWRGGLLAATLAGLVYVPHILSAWQADPEYRSTQYIEIFMFFVIGAVTGVLADDERRQRARVEQTAQKLAEVYKQLQDSFEQLRRADRLSALGELSAGLAHEIRNPLGSIEGAVQILGRQEVPEATRREFGRLAQEEVDRLKKLVSHFLEFARPLPPRRIPTEVTALLESVKALAAETAKMGRVQLRVEAPDGFPTASIDPEQIKQVLLNLVINAIQAMPRGGEVVLKATKVADSLALEIRDEGVGIEVQNLERIFDPFFTMRPGGTGLGLSIAYQIVNQHGGELAARKNPDRGMTFTVTLPLVAQGGQA